MLGLGWGEILLVAAVALVVVGPERLPRLLRDLGRMYGQVRRTADELRRSFVLEAERQDAEERYQQLQERRRAQAAAQDATAADAASGPPPPQGTEDLDPTPVPFGGATTVAAGTLDDDGLVPADGDDEPNPNALDPEAPHPVQPARSEPS